MAEIHSILANWMVLMHFGKVSWTQWMRRCAHFPRPFGSYRFYQCSEGAWQEGAPVRVCCILTSMLATKIRETNTAVNQDFECKTKGRVMPALLLCLSVLLSFKMLLIFVSFDEFCSKACDRVKQLFFNRKTVFLHWCSSIFLPLLFKAVQRLPWVSQAQIRSRPILCSTQNTTSVLGTGNWCAVLIWRLTAESHDGLKKTTRTPVPKERLLYLRETMIFYGAKSEARERCVKNVQTYG